MALEVKLLMKTYGFDGKIAYGMALIVKLLMQCF